MNLLEKYKGMVQTQKEPPPSPVFDNTSSTEKDILARIILNAITPIEVCLKKQPWPAVAIVESGVNMNASWPPEVQSLINWFMELETPTASFYLEPHRKVIDPEKFISSLRQEIAICPASQRGRNGALLYDLNMLRKILLN